MASAEGIEFAVQGSDLGLVEHQPGHNLVVLRGVGRTGSDGIRLSQIYQVHAVGLLADAWGLTL